MTEFSFSSEQRLKEISDTRERALAKARTFILLLGPSSTGKSTLIHEMQPLMDTKLEYVKPIMTRANRPEETDKISVSDGEFDAMQSDDAFVVVNNLYGVRYGTPLHGILEPLAKGDTPILDYPLATIDKLSRPEYDTLNFYVYPESILAWTQRMNESGRNTNGRLEAGLDELASLAIKKFIHPAIDISIVNRDGAAVEAARDVVNTFYSVTK
ncbi:MAG: hypothetical protein ABIP50_02340 [Candidatus Saccharimonadales bacterium]